jgi:hypothetical protein
LGKTGDDSLRDVVSTEQMKSGVTIEEERDASLRRLVFEALSGAALGRGESRDLIMSTARELWAGEDSASWPALRN